MTGEKPVRDSIVNNSLCIGAVIALSGDLRSPQQTLPTWSHSFSSQQTCMTSVSGAQPYDILELFGDVKYSARTTYLKTFSPFTLSDILILSDR